MPDRQIRRELLECDGHIKETAMHRLALAFLLAGTMACSEISVPLPDLGTFDPGTEPDLPGDDIRDAESPDTGQTDVEPDPGTPDSGPLDPGIEDPGTGDDVADADDPGEPDIFRDPQNGSYPCRDDIECLSGECHRGICTCIDQSQCDDGLWCDAGETIHFGQALCLPPRPLFAGCLKHVHCESGACDRTGYCAECAPDLDMCGPTDGCCAGRCADGCLGCGVSPDQPILTRCMSGCYDPLTQFCGPDGPEAKRDFDADCQFNHSWCRSDRCVPSDDGLASHCEPLILAAASVIL
jgi:hypothetical protein